LQKIVISHKPDILTNMDITVGKGVKSVDVTSNGVTRSSKRIEANKYNIAWANLKKGAELTISAKDGTGNVLEKKVLRLKEGKTTIEQDTRDVKGGNYSLEEMIENDNIFNQILDKFLLSELKIGLPNHYVNDIAVNRTTYTTTINIKTSGAFSKITVVAPGGAENEALFQGSGTYTRDISGLNEGDTITIRVYNDKGQVIQEKPAFVD
jgi:flagellar hook assembly protein FlgD